MTTQLQFTISPVQEYVSQARKTVDLWSGSYLLSYLTGCAAVGAIQAGAPIASFFPKLEDNPLIGAIQSPDTVSSAAVLVGSIPNRFSIEGSEEDAQRWGRAATQALADAWGRITEAAWNELVARHAEFGEAVDIWDRQVAQQWSVSWVVADQVSALAARKRLRAFEQTAEQGEKCTMCGYRQVLAVGRARDFWERVARGWLGSRAVVRGKERLCAVCTVKRLFPLVSKQAIGWRVSQEYPSTPQLAADPWLRKIAERPDLTREVEELARSAGRDSFSSLEGSELYEGYYPELFPDAAQRSRVQHALRDLVRAARSSPGTLYALLSMDGDRMGERLSRLDAQGRQLMSEIILQFSQSVTGIVERPGTAARLVYAGGEDVLALLPADTALEIAWELRERYRALFADFSRATEQEFTISGGLLYCPLDLDLRAAIRQVHKLEDAAKDAGRNSLAVAVWKGGGEILRVTRPWSEDGRSWVAELLNLRPQMDQYPTRFLYQIMRMIRDLHVDDPLTVNGLDPDAVSKLFAVEYFGSRDSETKVETMQEAEARIRPIAELSYRAPVWDANIIRLVRFLAEEVAA